MTPVEPKWVQFEKLPQDPTRVTEQWLVRPKGRPEASLGVIAWFGQWRTYAFYPAKSTVFEPTCLHDIAAFIGAEMDELRLRRKA